MSENKEEEKVALGEWSDRKRPPRRDFPGPRMTDVTLRVAFERTAYADVTAHAKQSVDAEICGVLVGEICRDDEGEFVHVRHIVQGKAARQASTHVTYTQETWNAIHEEMDRKYPKLHIVGWYHSHPGYGVEFSEMDLFIQRNFFSGPSQIGFVTDPLGGEVAICTNTDDGVTWIERFWVDGREHRCDRARKAGGSSAAATGNSIAAEQLESVEVRLSQVIRAMDDLRATIHRFVFWTGMTIATVFAVLVAYFIYDRYSNPVKPPEIRSFAPIPVKINDKTCVLGVAVVDWEIPPGLVATPQNPSPNQDNTEQKPAEQPSGQQTPGVQNPGSADKGSEQK